MGCCLREDWRLRVFEVLLLRSLLLFLREDILAVEWQMAAGKIRDSKEAW